MKCEEVLSCLGAYLDNELSAKEKTALEKHLIGCPACRREWTELSCLFNELRATEQLEPPADFTAKVMANLPPLPETAANKSVIWRRGFALGMAVLAIAAALSIAGVIPVIKDLVHLLLWLPLNLPALQKVGMVLLSVGADLTKPLGDLLQMIPPWLYVAVLVALTNAAVLLIQLLRRLTVTVEEASIQ